MSELPPRGFPFRVCLAAKSGTETPGVKLSVGVETKYYDSTMAGLTVPAAFEQHLTLGDGSPGQPLQNALDFDLAEVPNLYSTNGGEFRFKFQEHGVAYNETQASDYLVDVGLKVCSGTPGFSLRFSPTPVEKWGINFAGTVCVKHNSGEERVVYLPGTRTYDPAGITGEIRLLYTIHSLFMISSKLSKQSYACTLTFRLKMIFDH